jgi:hypothetical protein
MEASRATHPAAIFSRGWTIQRLIFFEPTSPPWLRAESTCFQHALAPITTKSSAQHQSVIFFFFFDSSSGYGTRKHENKLDGKQEHKFVHHAPQQAR